MRRPVQRAGGVAVLLATLLLVPCATPALGTWTDRTASPSLPVSTAVLQAPTALAATPGCLALVPRVNLSWTASTSTFTTGYDVLRRTGAGAYTLVGSVSGRSTVTFTDLTVALATSYSYVVAARVNSWSARSSSVSVSVSPVCV